MAPTKIDCDGRMRALEGDLARYIAGAALAAAILVLAVAALCCVVLFLARKKRKEPVRRRRAKADVSVESTTIKKKKSKGKKKKKGKIYNKFKSLMGETVRRRESATALQELEPDTMKSTEMNVNADETGAINKQAQQYTSTVGV